MSSRFVHETRVYEYLKQVGLKTPRFGVIKDGKGDMPFNNGEDVVVKGLADEFWHKSDEGAVHFCTFEQNQLLNLAKQMEQKLGSKYSWIETLVCEKVNFQKVSGLPTESFLSLKNDPSCGWTVNFGVGGIHTEAWAKTLRDTPVLMWPVAVYSAQDAVSEFKNHWLGKIWLGDMRQGKKLTTETIISDFFQRIWKLTEILEQDKIDLLEINPFVLDSDGYLIALDGVATRKIEGGKGPIPQNPFFKPEKLLTPQKIAIIGVSEKATALGTILLKNMLESDKLKGMLRLIRPGTTEMYGVPCVPDITHLKNDPADILIVSLPAPKTLEIINQLCEQGGGAEILYLVAGGIGDQGDTEGLGDKLTKFMTDRRQKNLWTPTLIGPNGMGMMNSNRNMDTFFIPSRFLPLKYSDKSPLALVSQSGAYIAGRLSELSSLPFKYAFSIGNQFDLKISDFLEAFAIDPNLKVIGLYAEGFFQGDARRSAQMIKKLRSLGKQVIFYKGGRSQHGMKAAAGHTGAMASDYDLTRRLFVQAGALVTENFTEFGSLIKWLGSFPNTNINGSLAFMTNAGYCAVGMADILGNDNSNHHFKPYHMTSAEQERLSGILAKGGLAALVAPTSPLDLTPMANIDTWVECADHFAQSNASAVVLAILPFTENLSPFDQDKVNAFAAQLAAITARTQKPIGVIIDAGRLYEHYRLAFENVGIPIFHSVDGALI